MSNFSHPCVLGLLLPCRASPAACRQLEQQLKGWLSALSNSVAPSTSRQVLQALDEALRADMPELLRPVAMQQLGWPHTALLLAGRQRA